MADGANADKALVSPQHSGDAQAITSSNKDSFIVSPVSIDEQLQREMDLSYPEVYLGPREDRSPEVVPFRDGSDAPEVVPSNDPGYHVDEKYDAPQWYRGQPEGTDVKQEEYTKHGGDAQPIASSLRQPEQNKSGFDAESREHEQESDEAKQVDDKRRRRLWVWFGIAVVAIIIVALAVGLGVALGTRKSGNSTPATTTSSASSTTPTSSSSLSTTSASTPTSTSSALRCPGSNSTTYTNNGKSFLIQCGIDYSGGNIDTLDASNLTYCINSCATTDKCIGATFLGAACYLKSTLSDPVYSNSEVAGGKLVS